MGSALIRVTTTDANRPLRLCKLCGSFYIGSVVEYAASNERKQCTSSRMYPGLTVGEIIFDALEEGFVPHVSVSSLIEDSLEMQEMDGLFEVNGECACGVGDIGPCGSIQADCRSGYRVDGCTCGEGCDFHIVPEKPFLKSGLSVRKGCSSDQSSKNR